jgi:hypothetical protein
MAVANTKSTIVTARDAGKNVPLYLSGAVKHEAVATLEVAAADDDNSVYRFVRVHSSWSPRAIYLYNDAITAGTAYHCGLYDTAENGGAAVDNDVFATSVDLSSARVAPLDLLFEALNIDKIEKRVWEMLGLTADPNKYYDLALIGATVGTAAGTISLRVEWVEQV